MNSCPRCGSEILPDDKFCGICGHNLATRMETNTITARKSLNAKVMRINLGVIYLKQGKYELAIENFRKVLDTDPENHAVATMLEQALVAREEN